MSLQNIENSNFCKTAATQISQALPEGNWNALTYRTKQACRYPFDASGVVFVVAAYVTYRFKLYIEV